MASYGVSFQGHCDLRRSFRCLSGLRLGSTVTVVISLTPRSLRTFWSCHRPSWSLVIASDRSLPSDWLHFERCFRSLISRSLKHCSTVAVYSKATLKVYFIILCLHQTLPAFKIIKGKKTFLSILNSKWTNELYFKDQLDWLAWLHSDMLQWKRCVYIWKLALPCCLRFTFNIANISSISDRSGRDARKFVQESFVKEAWILFIVCEPIYMRMYTSLWCRL